MDKRITVHHDTVRIDTDMAGCFHCDRCQEKSSTAVAMVSFNEVDICIPCIKYMNQVADMVLKNPNLLNATTDYAARFIKSASRYDLIKKANKK